MGAAGLTPLQLGILEALAGMDPPWTLTGGAALAGFHLRHRTTRDLDLFWHGTESLGSCTEECARRLRGRGYAVTPVQHTPAFMRLLVSDDREKVILDLVAEPIPHVDAPSHLPLGATTIAVDTRHEILVNKVCTLLERAEVRDLVDVRALLAAGGDLERALRDAPRKDAGFSPLMLAFILRGWDIGVMAGPGGAAGVDVAGLARFRDDLVARLLREARPE